jgi:hypothetical protein
MTIESYEQAVVIAQNFEIRQIWSEVIENASKFVGLFNNQQYIDFINRESSYEVVAKIIINTAISIDTDIMAAFENKFKNEFIGRNLKNGLLEFFRKYPTWFSNFENFSKFVKHFVPTQTEMEVVFSNHYIHYFDILDEIYETE